MANQALINLAKEYVVIGALAIGIGVLTLLFVQIFIRKKQITHNWKWYFKKAIKVSFAIYVLVVIGATLIRNNCGFDSVFYLRLFSSYKVAWNSGSYIEWRNLILNILMFVPLGIYLPMLFKKFRKSYMVYGVGFLCSLGIEVIQVVLKRGVGEIDDLFNNTLGTIIGYGLFILFYEIVFNKNQKSNVKYRKVACLQIPLVLTFTTFISLYLIYNGQEFGNLLCENTYRIKMSNVSISTELELSESYETAAVYEVASYTVEELTVKGNEFLSKFHATINQDETIEYEDTVVFYAENSNYCLWMDYKGGGYWFINRDINDDIPDKTLSENEIRECLLDLAIDIPQTAEYVSMYSEQESDGNVFNVAPVVDGNVMTMGILCCDINADGIIMQMRNYIHDYTYVGECEIYSKKEIYDMIIAGEFSYFGVYELKNLDMIIESMELSYALDSKGFYQPVYKVALLNGNDVMQVMLPAIK